MGSEVGERGEEDEVRFQKREELRLMTAGTTRLKGDEEVWLEEDEEEGEEEKWKKDEEGTEEGVRHRPDHFLHPSSRNR